MHKDPKSRLSINVALRHKWFTMKLDVAGRSVGEYEAQEGDHRFKLRHVIRGSSKNVMMVKDASKAPSKRALNNLLI